MNSHPEALSDWNILAEDLDCEKNPFLQMSQDEIQKLDAVLSSEQARALLRESSNDRLFSDPDKLEDVLNTAEGAHSVEENKLPAVLEETLGVSFKDLEHLVLGTSASTELFPEAAVGEMPSDILDIESQIRSLSLAIWLDHSYALHPPQSPVPVPEPTTPVAQLATEIVPDPPVICEALPQVEPTPAVTLPTKDDETGDNDSSPAKNTSYQSDSEQKDDDQDLASNRGGPRRRSQRQIEKITREQVEKIRAENAEMERKEREEMERKVLETTEPKDDDSIMNELEAVASELSKKEEVKEVLKPVPQETPPEHPIEQDAKAKDEAVVKRKRKKSHKSESDSNELVVKVPDDATAEKIKAEFSPKSKSPKLMKEGKSKRNRTNSAPISPSKKLIEEISEVQKSSKDKSPSAEKKKKKVKKEKSYNEDPEPALFSFPDKMIKGNEASPDGKLQRKSSNAESQMEVDVKKEKVELPTVATTVPPVKTEAKPEVKKDVVQNIVRVEKIVKTENQPNVMPTTKPAIDSEKPKISNVVKGVIVKKGNEIPGKVVKRIPSSEQKPKKVVENAKAPQNNNNEGAKLQPNSAKVVTDRPKPVIPPKNTKPKVLSNSDPNITTKEKLKAEILKKNSQLSSKTPTSKTSANKPTQKPREKSNENHKSESKSEHKSSKKKEAKKGEEILPKKHRERRTIKKKTLDPNEIHPNEVSDPEDYSDDPNDSDWGSEDDPEKLWCICKQPSNDRFMIQCDPCSNWFHGTCVGVSRQEGRQMERDGVEWHCPQCIKNAAQSKPTVEEQPKPKIVKKEVESKPKPVSSGKSTVSSMVTASQCIVCKSNSKRDSVYCGDSCIEQHAKEVLRLLSSSEIKTESKEGTPQNVLLATPRVVVMERWTGKLYTGPNAPTQESLMSWLKANPTFEALKPGPVTTTSVSTNAASKKAKTEKEERPAEAPKKPDTEPVRLNVRKTLKEILISRCKEAEDVKITDDVISSIAVKIEEELYKLFKDTNSKYKSKYRSLMFNVKDPRNQGLFRKIVNRKIPPQQLVRMSPEELASRELAKWRERENQHTIEMIKKEQLENRQMQSLIIKKTHKGEVEIEDDNMSSVKKNVEEKPDVPEEDMSDIKAMLSDTTSEHRTHLFDVNCQICTGRKAVSELEAEKNSPDKRKIKVARTISMEQPADVLSKDGSSVVVNPITGAKSEGKDTEGLEGKEKHSKKPRKKLVVIDEPSDLEPTSTVSFGSPGPEAKVKSVSLKTLGKPSVWKGFIFMLDVTKFVTSAHKVSGPTGSLSQEIPDTVQVCGRIPPDEVWSYLSKIKQGGTKELIVMRFQPANDEEKGPYEAFFNYLNSRKRYGVVRNSSKMIKDFYIIPLGSHSPVPTVLMPFDGPGLDASRPNLLLGVIVRHKHKIKVAAPVPSANPVPEKYEAVERSYTPPLDALPCQSTTVDSSISTSGTSAIPTPAAAAATSALNPIKTISPTLSPSLGISSPSNIPGILSPSTLIPSSLIASILAPKISGLSALKSDHSSDAIQKPNGADDEPYEPSYTPPLEKTSKFEEDKPYDPDDMENLDVQTKVDVKSYLEAPSPSAPTNPELEAQKKLLAELTRQVEEQKEQIEMQKTQVLAAAKTSQLCLDSSDILLPEMLQNILKNIQAKSGQNNDGSSTSHPDSMLKESSIPVKPTSLSNMSAKELVERAQRELADFPRDGNEVDRQPPIKKMKHAHNPIPTIGDSAVAYSQGRTNMKAEPPPPGVDVEELVPDYDAGSSYYPGSSSHQEPNPYPSLAPPFQQTYYPPPPHPQPRDSYHQGSAPVVQPPQHPPPPPPPLPPQQQQWVSSNRDSGPWPVNPPGDPYYQGRSWSGPWNQPPPPPPPVGWNGMPPWNPHGQDTDGRDSDLRIYQRRHNDRHYNRGRNRQ